MMMPVGVEDKSKPTHFIPPRHCQINSEFFLHEFLLFPECPDALQGREIMEKLGMIFFMRPFHKMVLLRYKGETPQIKQQVILRRLGRSQFKSNLGKILSRSYLKDIQHKKKGWQSGSNSKSACIVNLSLCVQTPVLPKKKKKKQVLPLVWCSVTPRRAKTGNCVNIKHKDTKNHPNLR
jgi:hypothetical protein